MTNWIWHVVIIALSFAFGFTWYLTPGLPTYIRAENLVNPITIWAATFLVLAVALAWIRRSIWSNAFFGTIAFGCVGLRSADRVFADTAEWSIGALDILVDHAPTIVWFIPIAIYMGTGFCLSVAIQQLIGCLVATTIKTDQSSPYYWTRKQRLALTALVVSGGSWLSAYHRAELTTPTSRYYVGYGSAYLMGGGKKPIGMVYTEKTRLSIRGFQWQEYGGIIAGFHTNWTPSMQWPFLSGYQRMSLWIPTTISAVLLPIVVFWTRRNQRKRHRLKLCPNCDYDLRAAGARCPECNALNPHAAIVLTLIAVLQVWAGVCARWLRLHTCDVLASPHRRRTT